MKISDRNWSLLLIAVACVGVGAVKAAPQRGYNSRIYEEVVNYWNLFGQLPARSALLGSEQIPGSTADFPALSLLIYRVVFSTPNWAHEWIWAFWQIIPALVVGFLVARMGMKVGLHVTVARALSLIGVVVAVWVAIPWEDKSYLFWLPLAAILLNAHSKLWGSVSFGLLAGWTGLAPASVGMPLAQLRQRPKLGVLLSVTSISVAGLTVLAAGGASLTLLANRSQLESNTSAGWFSMWQFTDAPPLMLRTALVLLVGVVVLLAVWTERSSVPAALVALVAFSLIISSNTATERLIPFVPLGVLLTVGFRSQIRYLIAIGVWLGFFFLGEITSGRWGYVTNEFADQRSLQVLFVNAPLIFIITYWVIVTIGGNRRPVNIAVRNSA